MSTNPPEPPRDPLLDLIPRTDPEAIPLLSPKPPAPAIVHSPVSGNRPLYWKEVNLGRTAAGMMIADMAWMCFGALVVVSGIFSVVFASSNERSGLLTHTQTTPFFFMYTLVPAIVLWASVGHRLSASITSERERRTLGTLLILPINRSAMLWSKWFGAFRRAYRPLIVIVLSLLAGTSTMAIHPLSAVLQLVVIATHCVFAASFGMFLSAICRSSAKARLIVFATIPAFVIGTWLFHYYPTATDRLPQPPAPTIAFDGLNPLRTMEIVTFGWHDARAIAASQSATAIAAGLFLYAALSAALWFAAWCRFRRETA
jgi:ABC-type Na+ efflux pump permease subunit